MAKKDHCGNRTQRMNRLQRVRDLGHYLIVTDTKETEGNYITGLKNTLPKSLQGRLVIKVIEDQRTQDLIKVCKEKATSNPQYAKLWIMFDRDEVKDFDDIIKSANREGINAAWSNCCLEAWFEAYFQNMTYCNTSEECWKRFAKLFKQKTGKEYKKANTDIYNLLKEYGDEEKAIDRARYRHNEFKENVNKTSEMNPCSTVYLLVDEIQKTIKANESRVTNV